MIFAQDAKQDAKKDARIIEWAVGTFVGCSQTQTISTFNQIHSKQIKHKKTTIKQTNELKNELIYVLQFRFRVVPVAS